MVTGDQILVQGKLVASVDEVLNNRDFLIPALQDALQQQSDRVLIKQAAATTASREVTIMGDRELPYKLLKRVMATCTAADYGRISLAVMQAPPEQPVVTPAMAAAGQG